MLLIRANVAIMLNGVWGGNLVERRLNPPFYCAHSMTKEYDGRRYDDAADKAGFSSEDTTQNGAPWPVMFAIRNPIHCSADQTCYGTELKKGTFARALFSVLWP